MLPVPVTGDYFSVSLILFSFYKKKFNEPLVLGFVSNYFVIKKFTLISLILVITWKLFVKYLLQVVKRNSITGKKHDLNCFSHLNAEVSKLKVSTHFLFPLTPLNLSRLYNDITSHIRLCHMNTPTFEE